MTSDPPASISFAAWDEVKRNGWKGLVAKDDGSRYVGGPTLLAQGRVPGWTEGEHRWRRTMEHRGP